VRTSDHRIALKLLVVLCLAVVPATASTPSLGAPPVEEFSDNAEVCEVPPFEQRPPGLVRQLQREGEALFFDLQAFAQQPSQGPTHVGEILSCASCHNGPAFTDHKNNIVGPTEHRDRVVRHTPHLLRLADTAPYGWDGRFPCLLAVIKGAIESPLEMHAGRPPTQRQLDALTAFVETLDVPDAVPGVDFDPELAAISERVFFEKDTGRDPGGLSGDFPADQPLTCATCHSSPKFTDFTPHKVLIPLFFSPVDPLDPGHVDEDGRIAGFDTPVLRGLRLTAPYFHEGGDGDPTATRTPMVNDPPRGALLELVAFYDKRFTFGYTAEEQLALVEFLLSL
jgi:hypothetical protein